MKSSTSLATLLTAFLLLLSASGLTLANDARTSLTSNSTSTTSSGNSASATAVSSIQGVNVTQSVSNNGDTGVGSTSASTNSKQTISNEGTRTIKNVPSIVAPALVASMADSCMGSVSMGVSIVGFSGSGGKTYVDEECVRRLDAREFRALGLNDVAYALLLQSPQNKLAAEAANAAGTTPNK